MPATWTLSPSLKFLRRGRGDDAAPVELLAEEGERVAAQRELDGAIILDHLAALGHRRQRDLGLDPARLGGGEQRQEGAAEAADPPQRLPPVEAEAMEGVGIGELLQRRRRHAGARHHVLDRSEGRVHRRRRDQRAMGVGKALHHAQAEAEREMGGTVTPAKAGVSMSIR